MNQKKPAVSGKQARRQLRYLLLWILIVWAAISVGFRYLMSDIGNYSPRLSQLVQEKTGLELSIGELKGRWIFFTPLLELKAVTLGPKDDGNSAVKLDYLAVEIDLIESLFTISPRIKRISLEGLSLNVVQDEQSGKMFLPGFPAGPDNNSKEKIAKALDQYLFTTEQVFLNDVHISILTREKLCLDFRIPHALLDNEWMNHELKANVVLDDGSGETRFLKVSSMFQGNPLELNSFSARVYTEFKTSKFDYWLTHSKMPSLNGIKPEKASIGLRTWIDINKGVLENSIVSLDARDIEFLTRQFQSQEKKNGKKAEKKNKEDAAKEKTKEASVAPVLNRHFIEKLVFNMELTSEVDINRLQEKQYLREMLNQSIEIKISDLALKWDDTLLSDFNLVFQQKWGSRTGNPLANDWESYSSGSSVASEERVRINRLAINKLPLYLLNHLTPFVGPLQEKKSLLEKMALRGKFEQLQAVSFNLMETRAGLDSEVYVSGYAKNLGVSSFKKVPGIKGVDFYFEYAPHVLGIELDTKNALLEKSFHLFRKDLEISSLKGNLLLEILPGDIVVHSDIASLKNDWLSARARFSGSAPDRYYQDGQKEIPAWSVQASLSPIPARKAKMFFLGKLPPSFLTWVDGFIQEGELEGDILIFAFAKKRLPDTFVTMSAGLDLREATLDYLPEKWPPLNNVEAKVLVQNDRVEAQVPAASVFDSRLYNGKVLVRSYLEQNLPRVEVTGDASGKLPDLQRLFLESELKEILGNVVEDWVLHGDYKSRIDLDIPISSSPKQKPSRIDVDVSTSQALIAIPEVGLGVKELESDLHYSLKDGLSSRVLKALFFDKQLEGQIETVEALGNQVIQISSKGYIEARDLRSWQTFWLFDNLEGKTIFDAIISIGELESIDYLSPRIGQASKREDLMFLSQEVTAQEESEYKSRQSVVRIDVETDLHGLSVNLPGDYRKTAESKIPSYLQLDILDDSLVYRMDYGERIGVVAKMKGEDFDRGRVHFSEGLYPLPAEKGLIVTGFIEDLHFEEWLDYLEKNLLDEMPDNNVEVAEGLEQPTEDPAEILNRMDLEFGIFRGFDQQLQNLNTFVTRENFKWRIDLKNEMIEGVVIVPDEDQISKENPIVAKLEYLKITEEQLSGTSGQSSRPSDQEQNISDQGVAKSNVASTGVEVTEVVPKDKFVGEYVPDDFLFTQLEMKSVYLGKTKHGRWRIDLNPDANGMDFEVHQLNYGLMTINGKGRWNYSSDKSVTNFKGHLRTSASTKLFSALNLRPSANSPGLMAIELKWPGSPLDFDYDRMSGKAGLEIFDGSIVEIDIKSKKFKALGIFNLGVITDIVTLRIFKKIGDALSSEDGGKKKDSQKGQEKVDEQQAK